MSLRPFPGGARWPRVQPFRVAGDASSPLIGSCPAVAATMNTDSAAAAATRGIA
eukprot:gene5260-11946_t